GRRRDPRRLQLLAALAGQHADLGRDQHVVAPAAPLQPLADQALGFAAFVAGHPGGIDVRRVDHHAACVGKAVEDGEGFLALDGPAEDIAAEHQPRRPQPAAAESPYVHSSRPCSFSASTTSFTFWLIARGTISTASPVAITTRSSTPMAATSGPSERMRQFFVS